MNLTLPVDQQALRDRYSFATLVRPLTGLVQHPIALREEIGTPVFEIAVADLGNLTMAFPHVATPFGTDARNEALGGAGADIDAERAWVRAVAEAAERYACTVYAEEDFVVTSARELGNQALDFARLPRLSEREYADPHCPFQRPNSAVPIRWTRGYSLVDRCERYVPAIMTHLYMSAREGERFWAPISTGVAAHTDLATALVSAICEVIERDAIALTWLARLQLPRIELDDALPEALAANYARLRRSLVHQIFFDATTDLGIPTVYALQLVDGHPRMAQYVNCATDFNPAAACAKTIREAAPARVVLQLDRDLPESVADFASLHEGAVYHGRSGHSDAFAFLLESDARRSLTAMEIDAPVDAQGRLRLLLERLRALDMEVIAVDLTTDEVRVAGLWVVRVVIPDLMPMTPLHRARYLGPPTTLSLPGGSRLWEAHGRTCEPGTTAIRMTSYEESVGDDHFC
ncbi:MAG: hypothetical protein GEU75_15380 [Dehalococcoidia bacterium]|nr:hypothetical protein [Dehalococcoidia bacterium]